METLFVFALILNLLILISSENSKKIKDTTIWVVQEKINPFTAVS